MSHLTVPHPTTINFMPNDQLDQYSEQETIQRREAALKRMLATPHKPHDELKLGRLWLEARKRQAACD
jgi:hypothetical protein